ncbi:MAG: bifunctional hydroxymethylpyrimidine kinase/phosphomethylpyrimidine kinase [Methanomassiliicoccaceae archaeon]|nr:bifunctional hydroxymethylpyrimidine kinase/phosphomethylpyrimidine kinase [Methanomassiliicoccaceae archaeon]
MKCALTIAGSDPIGGAGIQADIKAISSSGVHPMTVITAVTAQNTVSVSSVMPMPSEVVTAQLDAVLSDCDIRAVKTGMLFSADIVDLIADRFRKRTMPMVVDPVMIATVGGSLASDGLASSIRDTLMPICDLITPNKHEAEELSGMKINGDDDASRACEIMGKSGTSVYLKGGHMNSNVVTDILYHDGEFIWFTYPRLERAGHGSGCTLSAYITANLAKGMNLINAVIGARKTIQRSIATMYPVGKGEKVVNSAIVPDKD